MLLNIIIVKHETEAYCSELSHKAKYVFNKIRTSGINMIQVFFFFKHIICNIYCIRH